MRYFGVVPYCFGYHCSTSIILSWLLRDAMQLLVQKACPDWVKNAPVWVRSAKKMSSRLVREEGELDPPGEVLGWKPQAVRDLTSLQQQCWWLEAPLQDRNLLARPVI